MPYVIYKICAINICVYVGCEFSQRDNIRGIETYTILQFLGNIIVRLDIFTFQISKQIVTIITDLAFSKVLKSLICSYRQIRVIGQRQRGNIDFCHNK